MSANYEVSLLEDIRSFPLYACSKEIIRQYKPYLEPLDLTYTQFLSLIVLWEEKCISVKSLGEKLLLDSGTMTPVLKKLESKGYISRTRSTSDERVVNIELTDLGWELREKTAGIPALVQENIDLTDEEQLELQRLLGKMLNHLKLTPPEKQMTEKP